jgi:hypothetical protein
VRQVETEEDLDAELGTAVFWLDRQGKFEAGDLLSMAVLSFQDHEYHDGYVYRAPVLAVDMDLMHAWTRPIVEQVHAALSKVDRGDIGPVELVEIIPKWLQGDWREIRRQERASGVTNQATLRPIPDRHPTKHGMQFRSDEELVVYEALLLVQSALPKTESILIVPNCEARARGRTVEPDFLVTYRGRVGGLEVDGPYHRGRAAADSSRDQLLLDSGVVVVNRVVVEDAANPKELRVALEHFLARLRG